MRKKNKMRFTGARLKDRKAIEAMPPGNRLRLMAGFPPLHEVPCPRCGKPMQVYAHIAQATCQREPCVTLGGNVYKLDSQNSDDVPTASAARRKHDQ